MQGGQKPLCRFGEKCFKLQNGQCNFFHPPNQMQNMGAKQGGMNNMNNMGGMGGMGGKMPNKNWGGNDGNNNSFGHHQNQFNNVNPNNNYQNKTQGGFDKSQNNLFSLCRNYHFGIPCQYAENCNKKHYFVMNDENAIRRFNFMRNIPNNNFSKLSKFRSGTKDYFALRNGNVINFFEFNFQTKVLNDVFTWPLPELPQNLKYNFYDHKGEYIYYSFPNPQLLIEDMGIFHIPTQKTIHVCNSHSGRVTGMAHFNQNVLLTTSVAGELKVWVKEGQNYIKQAEYTQKLRLCFNPQNLKLQLLFLDISEVNGTKIITAGTNDGRLLFFIGNDLSFNQIQFKDQAYSKVFGIRYHTRPGNQPAPIAVVLLWNNQQTLSTLMEVNLNDFKQTVLVQSQFDQNSNKNTICIFEFIDSYLMVGNVWGELSLYHYPDTNQKVGAIMHQNTVNDIVYCEEQLKNTGTKIKYMLVLEKRTDKKEGSLGFYILK